MTVDRILKGLSRFQKNVYPKHRDLFQKLALGQRPEIFSYLRDRGGVSAGPDRIRSLVRRARG